MESAFSARKIYHIKIRCSKAYAPNMFMNPYVYLKELTQAVRSRYDMEIIEVKYVVSKTKAQKRFQDEGASHYDLGVQLNFNQIFKTNIPDLDILFEDAILLKPPQGYNPNEVENVQEQEKQKQEDEKCLEINKSIELLLFMMNNTKGDLNTPMPLEALEKFQKEDWKQFKEGQYEIYIKAAMNLPIKLRLDQDKNVNNPIQIKINSIVVKSYFHPSGTQENADTIQKCVVFSDWYLCCKQPNNQEKDVKYFNYFDTEKLQKNVQNVNESVRVQNTICINKNKKFIDSFQICSFLFSRIVIKAQINMGQIREIKIFKKCTQTGKRHFEYYFFLTYPPKYYISLMKKEIANTREYMRNWERIQNIFFLRNSTVKKNQFLRLYLFNNTFVRIKVVQDPTRFNFDNTIDEMTAIISQYNKTIPTQHIGTELDTKWGLNALSKFFDYESGFVKKIIQLSKKEKDKAWKIGYFILIIFRCNNLYADQLNRLIKVIQDNKDDLDIFIYVFWKNVTDIWGYNNKKVRFIDFILSEYEHVKNLKIKNLIQKTHENTDQIVQIFRLLLTPSGFIYSPPSPEMKGRLLKHFTKFSQYFVRVSIADDNQGTLKNQKYITKVAFRARMDEINIIQRKYIPLGWSPSQLRSYSLWYINQVNDIQPDTGLIKRLTRQLVLSFLGSFGDIENPAKRAARIGQSFSSSWTYNGQKINVQQIQDKRSQLGYLYTDGIGKISRDLLQNISLKLNIKQLSVIQVRYLGSKGILVLDENLPKNTVQLRGSMIKYKCKHSSAKMYLDVLDWNKYKSGFLNRQIIILLKTLGVKDSIFKTLHENHIQNISNLSFKDCSVFKNMTDDFNNQINNLQPANQTILQLIRAGFSLEEQPFFRGVLQTMKKNAYYQLKTKCNIRVQNSARIIGIIDQFGVLEENEVYCSIYDPLSQRLEKDKFQIITGPAIITRNPCLDPADIRLVKCIGRDEIIQRFNKLGFQDQNKFLPFVNCVVFPMKGSVPLTAQISGSDLDGDNFFISWETSLIPDEKKVCKANPIDAPTNNSKKQQKKVLKEDQMYKEMLQFFIDYVNYQKLGQIDNSHLVKADQDLSNFAFNKDCQQLCKIHGQAVDFPKTGFCPPVNPRLLTSVYPDFMQKDPNFQYQSESILGFLYRDIKDKIANLLQNKVYNKADQRIDTDLIKDINISFDYNEIKETLEVLRQYEKTLYNLISLVGIDTQYQIYSGNFSIAKDKVDQYGKSRLIATILHLRSRFFQKFFEDLTQQQQDTYEKSHQNDFDKINLFSDQTMRKAVLYYLVSYIYKFPEIKLDNEKFEGIRNHINRALDEFNINLQNRSGRFCGFVWFIIPKIMINRKRIALCKGIEEDQVLVVQKEQDKAKQEQQQDQEI